MIVIANELGTTPQQLFFEDDIEKINIWKDKYFFINNSKTNLKKEWEHGNFSCLQYRWIRRNFKA
jgi:hypothetical protein